MNDFFVGVCEALIGGLDRIDVTDEIRDGHIGRRQLLAIAFVAMHPRNREIVAFFGGKAAASLAGRLQRRVINFAALDHCNALVEQSGQ